MDLLKNEDILKKGLESLSIDFDEESIKTLVKYKNLLLAYNKSINLTAITDEREIYIKHFIDSASCLLSEYFKKGHRVIDIGTGAGFPGLVLKILDKDMDITLLDSLGKRVTVLKKISDELSIEGIDFIHGRAEDYGKDEKHRETYDLVLSRAVASLNVLSEYCIPFIKIGGFFLCQKGPKYKEELKDATKAIDILGGKLEESLQINLFNYEMKRKNVLYAVY